VQYPRPCHSTDRNERRYSPQGRILAVGGSVDDEDAASASLNADIFDPVTSNLVPLASKRIHASTIPLPLLPDASVWVAAFQSSPRTYEQHMEIYNPP